MDFSSDIKFSFLVLNYCMIIGGMYNNKYIAMYKQSNLILNLSVLKNISELLLLLRSLKDNQLWLSLVD